MEKLNGAKGLFSGFVSGENASSQPEKRVCASQSSEAVPQILKKMDRAATELMRAVRAFERGCNRWEAKNNLPDCLLQELPADLFNHYITLQRKIRDCWSATFQIPMGKGAPALDGVKDGFSSCSNSDFLVWLDKKEQIVYCKTPLPPKKVACYYAETKGKLQMRYSVVNAFAPALEKVFRPIYNSEYDYLRGFFTKTISILVVQPVGEAPVDVSNLDFRQIIDALTLYTPGGDSTPSLSLSVSGILLEETESCAIAAMRMGKNHYLDDSKILLAWQSICEMMKNECVKNARL